MHLIASYWAYFDIGIITAANSRLLLCLYLPAALLERRPLWTASGNYWNWGERYPASLTRTSGSQSAISPASRPARPTASPANWPAAPCQ